MSSRLPLRAQVRRACAPDRASRRRSVGRTSRPAVVARLVVAVLAGALLTTGCDLRLETPPPAPLVPDAVESTRQRTVADAIALRVLAERARTGDADPVGPLLGEVATTAAEHADALGGLYAPPTPTSAPSPTATESSVPAAGGATAAEVVALLRETAASARADAAAVPDGALGRVLAAVSASRAVLADALVAAGVPDVPAPSVDADGTGDAEDPTGGSGVGGPPVPNALPEGMTSGTTALVVQSEDALAIAWEVLGARVPELREPAAQNAAEHRRRARQWAATSGLDTQGLDPRRSQYDLPDALTAGAGAWDPTAARVAVADLERALGGLYGSLLADVTAGARSELVDALVDAARSASSLDGARDPLPTLERA